MNQLGAFFRNLFRNLQYRTAQFMQGRYGMDKLNIAILLLSLLVSILSSLMRGALSCLILAALSYALMILAIFRCLSRNTYRRYNENSRYLLFVNCLKDRQHRYFRCPKCRQMARVPRGKGKISISCPRCGEKFVRKS